MDSVIGIKHSYSGDSLQQMESHSYLQRIIMDRFNAFFRVEGLFFELKSKFFQMKHTELEQKLVRLFSIAEHLPSERLFKESYRLYVLFQQHPNVFYNNLWEKFEKTLEDERTAFITSLSDCWRCFGHCNEPMIS